MAQLNSKDGVVSIKIITTTEPLAVSTDTTPDTVFDSFNNDCLSPSSITSSSASSGFISASSGRGEHERISLGFLEELKKLAAKRRTDSDGLLMDTLKKALSDKEHALIQEKHDED